jgi:hypothetical protein
MIKLSEKTVVRRLVLPDYTNRAIEAFMVKHNIGNWSEAARQVIGLGITYDYLMEGNDKK